MLIAKPMIKFTIIGFFQHGFAGRIAGTEQNVFDPVQLIPVY